MKPHRPGWITAFLYFFGAGYALNGFAMLFVPSLWFFRLVPGVPETGAFNAHLVMDGGTFYIPVGIALIVAARDAERHIAAVAIAATATFLHAMLHIYSHAAGLLSLHHFVTEVVGIYAPAAVLSGITLLLAIQGNPTVELRAGPASKPEG
jgi:hypothetical protein